MEANTVQAQEFKCKNCGAAQSFDPASGMLICNHCKSKEDIFPEGFVESKPLDFDLDRAAQWGSDTQTFRCENCGATTTFGAGEYSGQCPYCGSKKVLSCQEFKGIKPNAVLPFRVSREKAFEAYRKYIGKRVYAPRIFKKKSALDQMRGVYCPCWTFDAATVSGYYGVAGKYYYVTVGHGKNRRTERRVRWFPVRGTYNRQFKNHMVEASPHLTQKEINKIGPFPYDQSVPYDARFLSGFGADHYNRGLAECWQVSTNEMKSIITSEVKRSINADVVQSLTVTTNYYGAAFKHMLLPVYVCFTKFKDKVFNFFINGINARVTGKTPLSAAKTALTVGIALLAAVGLGVLLYFLKK